MADNDEVTSQTKLDAIGVDSPISKTDDSLQLMSIHSGKSWQIPEHLKVSFFVSLWQLVTGRDEKLP